jgi:hypothetical protein
MVDFAVEIERFTSSLPLEPIHFGIVSEEG